MKIKSRKLRKLFWEIRRYAIIFAYHAIIICALAVLTLALCYVFALPEIIGMLIFG